MAWSSERIAAKLKEERKARCRTVGNGDDTQKSYRVYIVTTVERRRSINILLYSLKKGKVTE